MTTYRLRACTRDRRCPDCGGFLSERRSCATCEDAGALLCDGEGCDCCITCEACGSLDLTLASSTMTCRACAYQWEIDDSDRWHLDGGLIARRVYVDHWRRDAREQIVSRLLTYATGAR